MFICRLAEQWCAPELFARPRPWDTEAMRQLFAMPWLLSALMAAVGLLTLISWVRHGGLVPFLIAAVLLFLAIRFLAFTWIASRPVAYVDEYLAAGGVVVFWRPGCRYCLQLIRQLDTDQLDVPYWVNIWADTEAARRVAQYHGGDEVVPTIVTSNGHFVARVPEAFAQAKAMIDRVAR